jgi:hypothetical protein
MTAQYIDFPIATSFNVEKPTEFDPEQLTNMYAIYSPTGRKRVALTTTPGLKKKLEFQDGLKVRQLFAFGEFLYVVVSQYVYRVNALFTASLLGTLTTTTGYIGMAANQTQVILVDGIKGYIIEGATFTEITATAFPEKPFDVTYQDGYFIVIKGETNRFYISAINDGLQWNALDFSEILSKPDTLIGVRELHRILFLFGKVSIEPWIDEGLRDFPFVRQNNMLLEYGCAAPGSIAAGFDKLFWLAGDKNGVGSVIMTDGTRPTAVSTRAVDIQIQSFTNIEDARSFIYKEEGHYFYILNFTEANKTFVYDMTTNEWTIREMLNGDRHIAECYAFFNNLAIVGSYKEPIIYEMSRKYYDNDGEAIKRSGVTRIFLEPTYKKLRIDRLQIDTTSGNAILNTINEDPEIFLSISKDGGKSYGNIRNKSIGRIGERRFRTIWRRLATSHNGFVFKWEFYSNIPFDILGAALGFEVTSI